MRVELPETIEECHSLISQLLLVIEKQQAEIDELKAEVRELNSRLNQNSQNSHRPPSSDGFQKPKPAFSKVASPKRRGGQFGRAWKDFEKSPRAGCRD